jgi:K+ transporter
MIRLWMQGRESSWRWWRRAALFVVGFALCATILLVTTVEKFLEGGWVTLVITSAVVALCFVVRSHYRRVSSHLAQLYSSLEIPLDEAAPEPGPVDPARRTAAILVSSYGGLGIHTVMSVLRTFPGSFQSFVFLSVGVIDSGAFKGREEIAALTARTEAVLKRYAALARTLGLPATHRLQIGTDVVAAAEKLCLSVAEEFPATTFFIGKVLFKDETWYHRWLHNETAFALQKRLEWVGKPMVILPARLG